MEAGARDAQIRAERRRIALSETKPTSERSAAEGSGTPVNHVPGLELSALATGNDSSHILTVSEPPIGDPLDDSVQGPGDWHPLEPYDVTKKDHSTMSPAAFVRTENVSCALPVG